ncbi:hypothetical protein ACWEWX_13065, partial [Streptomyces asiaticus]
MAEGLAQRVGRDQDLQFGYDVMGVSLVHFGPHPCLGGQESRLLQPYEFGRNRGEVRLAIVAATFSFQVVYSDYYTCVDDALTQT